MLTYIDEINKYIFICSPKCGNTSISNYLNVNLHTKYESNVLKNKLNDSNYLKIIVTRDVCEKFIYGFNEDFNNNECYKYIDITFDEYLDFLKYCYDNKIKNCDNLNVFYKNINKKIWWGQCSNNKINITNNEGIIVGHIGSQKSFIKKIINDIEDDNVKVIDIKELSSYICSDIKNNKSNIINHYNNKTKLSEVKNNNGLFIKSKLLTDRNINIIKHIYKEDIIFIENIIKRYNNKTLVGKNNLLFLINDNNNSLLNHINNKMNIIDTKLNKYDKYLNKFKLFIFPDKEIICSKNLPEKYNKKLYRPTLEKYKLYLKDHIIILNNIDETDYYKTDTHMNNKGLLKYYYEFLKLYNLKNEKKYKIINYNCLSELNLGLGDLTWKNNIGNIILNDISDIYYKIDDFKNIYCNIYKNNDENNYNILDYNLKDISINYNNKIIDWEIISKNILYKKNNSNLVNKRILIFYDSILLHSINLYLKIFNEIYLIKKSFDEILINKIKPDFIYEFRIERFL